MLTENPDRETQSVVISTTFNGIFWIITQQLGDKDISQLVKKNGFKVHHLDSGDTKRFIFHSQLEDGGIITGYIGQNIYKSELGYFTPNLSVDMTIILNDDGDIIIK
mgnify:CR=1 FL=1